MTRTFSESMSNQLVNDGSSANMKDDDIGFVSNRVNQSFACNANSKKLPTTSPVQQSKRTRWANILFDADEHK